MLTQIWSACTDNFFSFQAIVCSFAQLLIPKIKIWRKCKTKPGDIILLQMCTINRDHMMYGSWDMKFNRHNVFVIVCIFLPFYLPPPLNSPKKNIWKKWKKTPGDIIILHNCTKNHDHMLCCSWDMVRDGCNNYFSFWPMLFLLTPHF